MELCGKRHASAMLSLGKKPSTHCIGGSMGPSGSLDIVEKR